MATREDICSFEFRPVPGARAVRAFASAMTVLAGHAEAVELDQIDAQRQALQDHYVAQQIDAASLFGSSPIEHVVPRRDRITLALATEYREIRVVPFGRIATADDAQNHALNLQGFMVSPLVAMSTTQFGCGFSGEYGRFKAEYARKDYSVAEPDLAESPRGYLEQKGELEYSGIGLFVYYIPKWNKLPRFLTPTLIAGGKRLRAIHHSSNDITWPGEDRTLTKYRYDVAKYELGLDLGIELVSRFTVLPWFNLVWVQSGIPVNANGRKALSSGEGGIDHTTQELNPAIYSDQSLFWEAYPKLTYGIDFAVRVGSVDVHLGGLLGLLGTLTAGSDRVSSHSVSIGVSYDLKSR